jgi:hypothetical protein
MDESGLFFSPFLFEIFSALSPAGDRVRVRTSSCAFYLVNFFEEQKLERASLMIPHVLSSCVNLFVVFSLPSGLLITESSMKFILAVLSFPQSPSPIVSPLNRFICTN